MHSNGSCESLVDDVMRVVTSAVRRARSSEMALIDAHGLSLSQFKIVAALECAPAGLSTSEVATRIALSPGAASRALDDLVRDGFLLRDEDAHDRRVRRVRLTEAGRALAAPAQKARREAISHMTASLTTAEREALSAGLRPLLEHLEGTL